MNMKVAILDGSKKNGTTLKIARETIENELRNKGVKISSFTLRDVKIAPCKGWFGCWLRTPGICVINDIGREITKAIAQSGLWVFLTPIIFGGYSSELKKALDRMIPFILPYFMKINGEIHHKPRYKNSPKLIAIGSLAQQDDESETIFKKLVSRNAINFHISSYKCEILPRDLSENCVKERVKAILSVSL